MKRKPPIVINRRSSLQIRQSLISFLVFSWGTEIVSFHSRYIHLPSVKQTSPSILNRKITRNILIFPLIFPSTAAPSNNFTLEEIPARDDSFLWKFLSLWKYENRETRIESCCTNIDIYRGDDDDNNNILATGLDVYKSFVNEYFGNFVALMRNEMPSRE